MKLIVTKTCVNIFYLTLNNEIPEMLIKQTKVGQRGFK